MSVSTQISVGATAEWLRDREGDWMVAVLVWGNWFTTASFNPETCVLQLGNKIF